MGFDRQQFLKTVSDSYSAYYNISRENLPDQLPLVFRAEFHKRDEMYWFSQRVPASGNEENEYAYFFSLDYFDRDLVLACMDFARKEGLSKVKPHREHQCSNIKTVFIAESFEASALDTIRKQKFQKSYRLAFWGYSSLLTCAVELSSQKVITNDAGRELKKYFQKLFSVGRSSTCSDC